MDEEVRRALAQRGIRPEILRTERRGQPTAEALAELRGLSRAGARSGRLSPVAYNLTVSHRHRFVWFRVAKVGTRSIYRYFDEHGISVEANLVRTRYPTSLFADYLKFGFVRHPLGRFVSAWADKVIDHNYFGFDPASWARMRQPEAFAGWVADRADLGESDQHLVPQVCLVDLTQVDLLGRLESFGPDFAEVCRRVGLPVAAVTVRNRSRQRPAASQELRAAVAEIYQRDFQVLGYSTSMPEHAPVMNG